jgi:membrane protein DedA with SNARE-associated domain
MTWIESLLNFVSSGVNLTSPIVLVVIFAIGAASEIGFPLFFALEIFLFFISYEYGPLSFQSLLMVVMLLLGRELGASTLYLVTRLLGFKFLNWLSRRSVRTMAAVQKFTERVNKNPAIMVAMVRITPGFLQVPSITAGVIRLKMWKFIEGVALSSLIYDAILIILGYSARFILPHTNTTPKEYLFIGFACLIALVWAILFFAFRGNKTSVKASEDVSSDKINKGI